MSLNCALVKSSTFEQEALDTHNKYRRLHGAPPLQLSRELSESSQKWANHLLSINALQHSNTNNGENLWYKWNSSVRDASGKLSGNKGSSLKKILLILLFRHIIIFIIRFWSDPLTFSSNKCVRPSRTIQKNALLQY